MRPGARLSAPPGAAHWGDTGAPAAGRSEGGNETVERYDRDELLARVDLAELFSDLVGSPKGRGRSAMWPCPAPDHAQTGRTPPVSVDGTKGLWRCHACGAGGSAIDLVALKGGLSVADAIAELARRVGLRPREEPVGPPRAKPSRPSPVPPRGQARPAPEAPQAAPGREALEAYVAACQALLWRPEGERVLSWLRGRGLGDEVLRSARVGADPGPEVLPRAEGLPRRGGPGAVFPVLGPDGRATYCQLRLLAGRERRYDNPQAERFGPNPRLAVLPAPPGAPPAVVAVCEGMPDALTAASAGLRAAAVLGAGYPDAAVARRIVGTFPTETLVVCFDGDEAGERGAETLAHLLAAAGAGPRVWRLEIPERVGAGGAERDLNAWAQAAGAAFPSELADAWERARPAGWTPAPSAGDLLPGFLATQADVDGALAVPTGLAGLDELLARGGWRPGVVLLGGLAGVGKSAFALHAALAAARAGHPACYVSVEQGPAELMGRLFCKETGHPIADYWNRDRGYLADATEAASRLPLDRLFFYGDPYLATDEEGTVGRIRRLAAQVAAQTGSTPLVVVDYLQRMRPPEADRRLDDHRQISLAGLGLRQLARDLSAPVLAISSVNRQSYDKAASLDAFKGSGDLEYDADACLLLRLQARSDEEARALARAGGVVPVELYMVKNRYGPVNLDDPVRLDFDRGRGGFRERQGAGAGAVAGTNGSGPPHVPPLHR